MLHRPLAPNHELRLGGQPRCRCGAPTLRRYRSVPCCRGCAVKTTLREVQRKAGPR